MEFLAEYGIFLAKLATFAFILILVAGSVSQFKKSSSDEGELEVKKLNDRSKARREQLKAALLDKKALKLQRKAWKQKQKQDKGSDKEKTSEGVTYVIEFKGDIYAKTVAQLREEISAILAAAEEKDEVLVKLESGGGVVHGYGLAASQLDRIRKKGIRLTVAVDKVAASGGYMMACVADHIVAAPFAVLGSIGVLGQVPNFHRLLDKHDIDFEMHTAGEYKRTLTMFAENTDKGREKFVEELEKTHSLFKAYVAEHRAQLDLDRVATGEIWFGRQALDLQLVDELMTSDEYVQNQMEKRQIIEIKFTPKTKLPDKLARTLSLTLESSLDKLGEKLRNIRFMS